MKDVTVLLKAVEDGLSPIDAVCQRTISIILEDNPTSPQMESLVLAATLKADLQVVLIRYQMLFKKYKHKEIYERGVLPNGIVDFSYTVTNEAIDADYYDDRVKGDARISINNIDFFNWIKSNEFNSIKKDPLGPEEETEIMTITKPDEFINYYLEEWHVVSYLIYKGIF